MLRTCTVCAVGLALALGVCAAASAQDEIGDLRRTIERLTQRLDELEASQKKLEADQEEQEIEQEAITKERERPKGALDVYWKDGLRLDSAETTESGKKAFRLKIGGRIQNDWGFFSADDDLETVASADSGTEFRRARMAIEGIIYEDFQFKAQYDFGGGDADFKDVYMAANHIPWVGQLKIGHFKEPGSLNELTSSKYITLMERALPNVFAPGRNTGIQLMNNFVEGRMTAAAGVFRDSDAFGTGTGSGNWAVTGRLTGLPYYARDGRRLVHLGVWGSYRNDSKSSFRVRQRPEAHLPGRFVTTFDQIGMVDSIGLFGAEVAGVWGPASVQAEYMLQNINRVGMQDLTFQGYYVLGSYFITGEHRPYKKSAGVFDKVKPKKNFQIGEGGGPGAWELTLRYSSLNLDDGDVFGGDEWNITAGVNWYLNPNMRIMCNYVHADVGREESVLVDAGTPDQALFVPIDGSFDGFMARFQVFW